MRASLYSKDDCDGLLCLFNKLASQLAKTYKQEFDDVLQDCILEWATAKPKYNANRGKASTFYSWVILTRLPQKYKRRLKRSPEALTGHQIDISAQEPDTMPEGYLECLRLAEIACSEKQRCKTLRAGLAELPASMVREAQEFLMQKEIGSVVYVTEVGV